MKKFTPEFIEKARQAKDVAELLAMAKENNVELTEEEAAAYYAQMNPALGELSDDELDNVAGGACEDTRGSHVQLPGGTCPHCGAKAPSGSYNYMGGHYGFSYYIENLDCCGNRMTLGHADLEQLIEIG